jgi:hypothetical protein
MMESEASPMPGTSGNTLSLSMPVRTTMNRKLLVAGKAGEGSQTEVTPAQPPFIFDVPREIIELIQSQLTYHEIKPLRETCKASTQAILLDDVKNAHAQLKATLLLEEAADYNQRQPKIANFARWARAVPNEYRTYWSSDTISNIHKNYITRATHLNCYICLYNLPRACFTDRQATGARSLGHKDAKMRFCTNCGVKRHMWPPGTVLKLAHKSYVVCKSCRSIQKGEPCYRSLGVCSKECQALMEEAQQPVETKVTPAQQTPANIDQGVQKETKSTAETSAKATASSRATRCLRCWGIDHTEKAADGDLGMRLCKGCEVIKSEEAGVRPPATSHDGTVVGR